MKIIIDHVHGSVEDFENINNEVKNECIKSNL